jgi:biopolymer transport protein ExbD
MRRTALQSVHGSAHHTGRVNVTPLIDVVMVLIVFYLIVGHLVLERRGEGRLPEARYGRELERAARPLTLSVIDGEMVLVDGQETPLDRLQSVLEGRLAREGGVRVELRAGRDRPYGQVEPLIHACRDAGVRSVELVTEKAP